MPGAGWVGLSGTGFFICGLPRRPAMCYARGRMTPNTKSTRRRTFGAVDPATLTLIAVIGLGIIIFKPSDTPGRKHWWQVWKKNPVEQVQKMDDKVDAAKAQAEAELAAQKAKIDAEKAKQLDVAHDAAIGTQAAIVEAQNATAAGKLPVRELDTAKQLADTNVDAMDEALGKKSLKRIQELETMVTQLNNGVAAGAKALELMQDNLDRSVQREANLKAEMAKIEAAWEAKVKAVEADRDAAVKREGQWALERDAIANRYENLKFYAYLIAGGLGFLWLSSLFLPILARFFPALSALSKTIGGLWAPGVQYAGGKAEKLSEDLVAMHEMMKGKLEEKFTPEEVAAIKKEIADDWMTTQDGSAAAVERIKQKLRL